MNSVFFYQRGKEDSVQTKRSIVNNSCLDEKTLMYERLFGKIIASHFNK